MTTGIAPIFSIFHTAILTGMILVGVGMLATAAMLTNGFVSLAFILPQQVILMYGMLSSIINIVAGHYSDGYTPSHSPHLFIANDQIMTISLTIFHTCAITEIYAGQYLKSLWKH